MCEEFCCCHLCLYVRIEFSSSAPEPRRRDPCSNSEDLPTFPAEEAVHLHAGARVGHAERRTGNQSLLGWAALGGPDQTPTGPFARPFQQLHRLAWRRTEHRRLIAAVSISLRRLVNSLEVGLTGADRHLRAASCCEVLKHDRQLTAARELQTHRQV